MATNSLLTTCNDDNRVVTSPRVITYEKNRISGQWSYNPTINTEKTYYKAWEYKRLCNLQYKYIGLTEDAANTKASTLSSYYTRSTEFSRFTSDGEFEDVSGGTQQMADVKVVLAGQGKDGANHTNMYEVQVNVHEEDTKLRIANAGDAEDVINISREYDGAY